MINVTIYTKPNCPYCIEAKKLLQSKQGFAIYEIDIGNKPETAKMVKEELGPTVPQIVMDGVYIGGYDQLKEQFNGK